jgi:hypothetical protein
LTEPVRSRKRFLIRGRRKQLEVSYNPGTVIGSGSFDGGRPAVTFLADCEAKGVKLESCPSISEIGSFKRGAGTRGGEGRKKIRSEFRGATNSYLAVLSNPLETLHRNP